MGKILLVGGYPPPYGGISVHVKRLFEVLKRDHSVFVLDMYGDVCGERQGEIIRCGRFVPFNLFKALFFIKKINAEIVHCHVSAISKFLLAGIPIMFFAGDSARKIVTIHSGGFVKNIENFNIFQKTLFVFLIEKIDHVIVVNKQQKEALCKFNVSREKISVIPAFLPPTPSDNENIMENIRKLRESSDYILLSSGYALPYYGFHTILDALRSDFFRGKKIVLMLALYNQYDEDYVDSFDKFSADSVTTVIYRDLSPEDFALLMSQVDLYVRATDRDGDAVAVREALYFKKIVVASDCVVRPTGVYLFETMNASSLSKVIERVLVDFDGRKYSEEKSEYLHDIEKIYGTS